MPYRALALAMVCFSFASHASAHGTPAAATSLLGLNGQDATLVRLTRGLAHRVPDGFRFICPEAWGGDVTAPAAAIPYGPALVASEMLFIVEPDGRISPHPNQVGVGIALASNRDALFGLFKREGQFELRRMTESTSDLVRVLDEPFGALAASDSELALLGWSKSTLVLQTLSLTGELRERVTWSSLSTVAYAELHLAGERLFVSIWGSSVPWVSIGRVTERGYEPVREAHVDIVGPVTIAAGTLVALDGSLETLEEEGATLGGRDDYVTCLRSDVGQPYACAHGDVLRVDQHGLGTPLFELASLREPDYQTLPEAMRPDCSARWLDLRDHVTTLAQPSASADAAASDAGAQDDAAPGVTEVTSNAKKSAGCALSAPTARAGWLQVIILVAFALRGRAARTRLGRLCARTEKASMPM